MFIMQNILDDKKNLDDLIERHKANYEQIKGIVALYDDPLELSSLGHIIYADSDHNISCITGEY